MKEFNFSKKRKAQVYIIITTMLLCISACAFSNFDTYADGNINLIDFYDMDSSIFDYSNVEGFTESSHISNNQNYYNYLYENDLLQVSSSEYTTSDYPHYLFYESVDNSKSQFIPCPEDAFVFINSSGFSLWINNSYYSDGFYHYAEFYGSGYSTPGFQGWGSKYSGSSSSYNGTGYNVMQILFQQYNWQSLLKTDLPVYYSETLKNTSGADFETNLNPSDNISSEDACNNLYFKDCDISYSCTGNTNGNIVCQAILTPYQKEHLDEFLVVYNFTFDVKGYNVNNSGEQSVLGNKIEFSKNYSYQQTLGNFYDNSSSKVFTLKDIEQNINTTDIDSEYGNLYQLFTYLNNNTSSSGDITEFQPFKYIKCTLKTTMFVTLADVNLNNITDNNIRSGSYSETYNFVKGTSSLNSDGILNNSNPVETNSSGSIDSNEDLASLTTQGGITGNDMPSSNNGNGSGSGSVSGDNNIVINNNPTFNNNSNGSGSNGSLSTSGGSPSNSGLFSTLVDFVKGDTESTSESISELVDSDGWISVINSYYTFIPEKFWTLLFTVMGTCIGIMVVGFIISIVLRFIS